MRAQKLVTHFSSWLMQDSCML
uniref:Uncharacterized protein n=1 Tax=Arundo donax TaxID=35708 RepID=A0A0A9B8X9_ARUDO